MFYSVSPLGRSVLLGVYVLGLRSFKKHNLLLAPQLHLLRSLVSSFNTPLVPSDYQYRTNVSETTETLKKKIYTRLWSPYDIRPFNVLNINIHSFLQDRLHNSCLICFCHLRLVTTTGPEDTDMFPTPTPLSPYQTPYKRSVSVMLRAV